jgi:hypothetical protein
VPIRDFDDTTGNHWQVWSTVPVTEVGVAGAFRQGWLTFDSGRERRRLAPIPADWETASSAELGAYCDRAVAVRLTPPGGVRSDARDGGGDRF